MREVHYDGTAGAGGPALQVLNIYITTSMRNFVPLTPLKNDQIYKHVSCATTKS